MARARSIKPGFFTNDVLAEISPLGRLLFIGLWTIADRAGRLEDRPRRIKAEVLPYDDCDCDTTLSELQRHGFILRYEANGERFIQVLNFCKHQNPHVKESESTIPAPDEHGANGENTRVNTGHHTSMVQAPETHSLSPADSLNPITDSPLPEPDTPRTRASEHFDRFWSAYPRKTAKRDAERAFRRLDPGPEQLDEMLSAIARQRLWSQWQQGYIPHPATWINGKRWQDEEPQRHSANGRASPVRDDVVTRNLRNLGVLDDAPNTEPVFETTGVIRR